MALIYSFLHHLKTVDGMDLDSNDKKPAILPEIDIYLHLNVIIYLLDKKELDKVKNMITIGKGGGLVC